MIKEAIDRILELGNPAVVCVEERRYSTLPLTPVIDPRVKALDIHTLTGITDYLERIDGNPENPAPLGCFDCQEIEVIDKVFIHVVSYNHVDLYGTLMEPWKGRNHYLSVSLIDDKPFPFGKWMDLETAIIELQSKMVPDAGCIVRTGKGKEDPLKESNYECLDRGNCLPGDKEANEATDISRNDLQTTIQLLSTVTECNQRVSEDDGISQLVTIQRGVRGKEQAEIANIVQLRPFRTFREIEQPSSFFVRRIRPGKEGPEVAFFEADGGAWKLESIQRIKDWLSGKLLGVKIIA
jgi:hypothetical protein